MIELSRLNELDWVIVVVLTLSTLLSLWRGFVREALSLLGWVAAFIVANLFVDRLSAQMAAYIDNATGRYVACFAVLFVITLVTFSLIVWLAVKLVRVSGLTVLDRVLGTVFGFARGVIIVLLLAYGIQQLVPPKDQEWLHRSELMPHLTMLADWVQVVFAKADSGQAIST